MSKAISHRKSRHIPITDNLPLKEGFRAWIAYQHDDYEYGEKYLHRPKE